MKKNKKKQSLQYYIEIEMEMVFSMWLSSLR